MPSLSPIDLSNLPAPAVVETPSFEAIRDAMLADLVARVPSFTALLPSDPAYAVLEVAAYRETVLRADMNDKAKAVMLAYAVGSNLDNLAALVNVQRKTLVPANPSAFPPTAAVMETDTDLRYRVQLAFEGISTAGPSGSYEFHALSVDTIKDAVVAGPPTVSPGNVRVTILSRNGNGAASAAEIAAVQAVLNSEDIRPLTDLVTVQGASIVHYHLNITLHVLAGWDATTAKATAEANVAAYAASVQRVGADVRVSGIYAAAHVAGVERVVLSNHAGAITEDLSISDVQASYLASVTVNTVTATP